MSRQVAALFLAFAALFASAPLAAQEKIDLLVPAPAPRVTAEEVIDTAKQAYGPPEARARPACPAPKPGDEIVVCAEQQEQSQFRTEGSPVNGDKGAPRAPNVETQYPMVGPGVSFRGCFIPPCPKPMAKIIDLKAIPDAPPGSDADRAARGLAPARGSEERAAKETATAVSAEARGTPPPKPAGPDPAKPATPPGSASPGGGP